MARNWKEFDDGPTHAGNGKYVSANRLGEIVMNRRTFEEMGQPESVVLLFETDTDTIGIKPASPLMPNAFTLKTKGTCLHRVIRAKPFLVSHDIRLDGTVRFPAASLEDGVLVLELRNMVNATRGPRNTRRRR